MRWKKDNERKPIFNQDKFFFIFLWWSCLDLLEIALLFHKNSRIYVWWEMLTNILSICYIFLEKKIALFKKTGKKKQFCLKMDVLSIFCFPLTFSILWSELWHAKTVTCYQYSLKISWLFSYWFRSYKGFAFHSPIRRRCRNICQKGRPGAIHRLWIGLWNAKPL